MFEEQVIKAVSPAFNSSFDTIESYTIISSAKLTDLTASSMFISSLNVGIIAVIFKLSLL